tara:strand:+ start:27788 stop:28483 length:696 start_codon:yes stop_codon:yes gene_type:complete
MNNKYSINLKTLRDQIEISSLYEDTNTGNIINWLNKRKKFDKTIIKKVGLSNLNDWEFNKQHNLQHKSKQFFDVIGIKITSAYNREAVNWDQPILNQKHGGVLAILIRKRKNIIEFLLYARREPGDKSLKLCPSFSATQSNLNQAHGGKKTKLHNLIFSKKRNLICETTHYEEGARFFQKPNKNLLIKINKSDEKYINDSNFIWCNLSQIKKLNLLDGIINPFVKTILFMI